MNELINMLPCFKHDVYGLSLLQQVFWHVFLVILAVEEDQEPEAQITGAQI